MQKKNEFIKRLIKRFKKPLDVKVGDVGVFQDVLTFYTSNQHADVTRHSVFTKIEVVEVFEELVEVKILDMEVANIAPVSFLEMAKASNTKYLDPRLINWKKN